ncbi:MAG: Ig domain-containing protein, partial [Candidatus Mariimomonas ferrooxydans]
MALEITTTDLPRGTAGIAYSFTVRGNGGTPPYTWSATGLPAGFSIDPSTGEISGTTIAGTYDPVTITLTDSIGIIVNKTFTLQIDVNTGVNIESYNVKVVLVEEPLTDVNGNDIYDPSIGESYTDSNANDVWDGKQGVFQKYWDENNPRARWGLTYMTNQGVTIQPPGCIPAGPASAYYTNIQNAQPEPSFPLSDGLYGDINYYGYSFFGDYDGTSYTGCDNSDPMDATPCRKNFVLIISSGSDVSGSNFSQTDCNVTNNTASLVQNACYGANNDLRSDKSGTQIVLTYVVNTMGATNTAILSDTAEAGKGQFYEAQKASELEDKLDQAFRDMLARAASGTAASVLASGEGRGANIVQAIFYPLSQELQSGGIFDREILWIGRLSNFWFYVDPFFTGSSIYEDDSSPNVLNLTNDNTVSLYFDTALEKTMAEREEDTDGDGIPDSPVAGGNIAFEHLTSLWEAGRLLWERDITVASTKRKIYTTINGTSFLAGNFSADTLNGDSNNSSTLRPFLDAADDDEAEALIRYLHGEDDPVVSGTTYDYRSRMVAVDLDGSGGINGLSEAAKVWKLGDVLNSTPRISSWIQLNTYDDRYNDATYTDYINTSDYCSVTTSQSCTVDADCPGVETCTDNPVAYKTRGMVFAGANDGMLHAFKLGQMELDWTGQGQYEYARMINPDPLHTTSTITH